MSLTADEFDRMRRRLAEIRSARERASGAKAELVKRLNDEHGVVTPEQAAALIRKLEHREAALEKKLRAAEKELDQYDQGEE